MTESFTYRVENETGNSSKPWKDLSEEEKVNATAQAYQFEATIGLRLPILPYGYRPNRPIIEEYFLEKGAKNIKQEDEKIADFFERLKGSYELFMDAQSAIVSVNDPNKNYQYEMHLESLYVLNGISYDEYRKLYFPEGTLTREHYQITADTFQKDVIITFNGDDDFYRPIGFIMPSRDFDGKIQRKFEYLQEGQFSIIKEIES